MVSITRDCLQALHELLTGRDTTSLWNIAKAIHKLEFAYGLIPNVRTKGKASVRVADMLNRMQDEETVNSTDDHELAYDVRKEDDGQKTNTFRRLRSVNPSVDATITKAQVKVDLVKSSKVNQGFLEKFGRGFEEDMKRKNGRSKEDKMMENEEDGC
ncbi:vacuolar protein sorting-associated protein 33 [Tanacetum coccineum]